MTEEEIQRIIEFGSEKGITHIENSRKNPIKEDFGEEEDKALKVIEGSTEDILKKEQGEIIANEIKKRFLKIKSIRKENFNMFEVAILCHRVVEDYKKLAKLNHWEEIEGMFKD